MQLFESTKRRPQLFGRRQEIRRVLEWLAAGRNVVLRGAAGSGKTALAQAIAARTVEAHVVDRVIVIDLSRADQESYGVSSASVRSHLEYLVDHIADAVGLRGCSVVRDLATRIEMCSYAELGPKVLVVVEHVETLEASEHVLLDRAVGNLPENYRALLLSRCRLSVNASELMLAPLSFGAVRDWIEQATIRYSSLYTFFASGPSAWHALYSYTRGYPYAVAWILSHLAQQPGAMRELLADSGQGLRPVAAEILSGIPLGDRGHEIMCVLSLFRTAASLDAVRYISGLDEGCVAAVLDRLCRWCIVEAKQPNRFQLTQCGRLTLCGEPPLRAYQRRYDQYWAHFVSRAACHPDDVRAEWANVQAAAMDLWRQAEVVDRQVWGERDAAALLLDMVTYLYPADRPPRGGGVGERLLLRNCGFQIACSLHEWSVAGHLAAQVVRELIRIGRLSAATEWIDETVATFLLDGTGEPHARAFLCSLPACIPRPCLPRTS